MSRTTPPASWPEAAPPDVARRPTSRTIHGTRIDDDYAWLRAGNWRDVLRDPTCLPDDIRAVLDAENAYAARHLDPLADLVATLKGEMRGRIKEDDASVPLPDGPWLYHRRYRDGGQHPLFCREPGDGGAEELLLDGDREAEGHAFFALGDVAHTPDHAQPRLERRTRKGSELYTIRIRDLATGDRPCRPGERTPAATSSGAPIALAPSTTCASTRITAPPQVFPARARAEPRISLVFEEQDPAWFVDIDRTIVGRLRGDLGDRPFAASECHLRRSRADRVPCPAASTPRAPELALFGDAPRRRALHPAPMPTGRKTSRSCARRSTAPGKASWVDLVPHRRGADDRGDERHFPTIIVRLEREARVAAPRRAVASTTARSTTIALDGGGLQHSGWRDASSSPRPACASPIPR